VVTCVILFGLRWFNSSFIERKRHAEEIATRNRDTTLEERSEQPSIGDMFGGETFPILGFRKKITPGLKKPFHDKDLEIYLGEGAPFPRNTLHGNGGILDRALPLDRSCLLAHLDEWWSLHSYSLESWKGSNLADQEFRGSGALRG
jgi:hypothetical protein